jgi:hypothetical protein
MVPGWIELPDKTTRSIASLWRSRKTASSADRTFATLPPEQEQALRPPTPRRAVAAPPSDLTKVAAAWDRLTPTTSAS